MSKPLSQEELKKLAAEKAVESIKSGMLVGLGTGSTVKYALLKIGQLVKEGLSIQCIATSQATEKIALEQGITLTDFSKITSLDLTIDGADEINHDFHLIKGGGGALFREKIVAQASKKMIVITDEKKLVRRLGVFPLPIEIVAFGWETTVKRLESLCSKVVVRKKEDTTVVTDNGNFIADCHFSIINDPVTLHQQLKMLTGVVETGLFTTEATSAVIGKADGTVEVLKRAKRQ
ncbi:MAG: ribose-5-phosphate isomerase RpiA [bacterium]